MEKIAEEMSGLLEETLDLYQNLKVLLIEEKKHITEMDVKSIWSDSQRKKGLVEAIESVTLKILDRVRGDAAHLEMTVQNFKVRDAVSALPLGMQVKSQLKALGLKIDGCKQEISRLAQENKRYIAEYLSVIDGIFSTIRQSTGQDQYSRAGRVYSTGSGKRLIHTEV